MKKIALTAVSLLISVSAWPPTSVARPLERAPAPVAVATYNWNGCYIRRRRRLLDCTIRRIAMRSME